MSILRRAFWRLVFGINGGFEVRGSLPDGGCVVIGAHRSHADAPALLAAIDAGHRPVVAAAADYWFHRRIKAIVCRTLVAGFPVRRTGGGFADLAGRSSLLADGRAVVVFPAGSRHSVDGRFHAGAFRLAQGAGLPIVPVQLHGTSDVVADGRLHRARVTVEIGAPVTVTDPAACAVAMQARLAQPS